MQLSTPEALHKIIGANNKTILIDGHQSCQLNAMSVAFNYHTIDINETSSSLTVKGISPVVRNEKFLIK